jgi:two-component system response regulator VicR
MSEKTILIAEDERMLLKTLEFRVKKDRYNVKAVSDGKAAVEFLQEKQPDLVVTDIMMPYVNGLELVQIIKEKYPSVPVIVLSTLGQEETVMKAFDLGASDFMTKPFSPNELSIRIKKLLA